MNIKMADFFKLPCQGLITGIDSRRCNTDNCDGVSEYDYVESAIDSYDANQALIAKLAEQIKMLRHALTEIKNTPSARHDECSWMASVALEATKDAQ